jgi:hypothetical protein
MLDLAIISLNLDEIKLFFSFFSRPEQSLLYYDFTYSVEILKINFFLFIYKFSFLLMQIHFRNIINFFWLFVIAYKDVYEF